jgi:hypothetical protein
MRRKAHPERLGVCNDYPDNDGWSFPSQAEKRLDLDLEVIAGKCSAIGKPGRAKFKTSQP